MIPIFHIPDSAENVIDSLRDIFYNFMDFLFLMLGKTYFLVTNVFIGGFIHFVFNLTGYISLVFVIVEVFIVGFSLMNCTDELSGKKSPITIMITFFGINFRIFIGIFQIFAFTLKQAYTLINAVKPW